MCMFTDCVRMFSSKLGPYGAFMYFIVTVLVAADCPDNAEREIRLCIQSSLPNFGLGPPTAMSPPNAIREGIDMMRESCQTSKLVDAAKCVENILNRCKGITEQEQMVQRLFNKDKLMDTVKYFCNNLEVYETHTSCIAKQHKMVAECSKDEHHSYMMKLTAKASMDVLILSSCSFMNEAMVCLTNMVSLKCGLEAAALVERILLGMRPPACGHITPKYYPVDGSGVSGLSPPSVILLALCVILPGYLFHRRIVL